MYLWTTATELASVGVPSSLSAEAVARSIRLQTDSIKSVLLEFLPPTAPVHFDVLVPLLRETGNDVPRRFRVRGFASEVGVYTRAAPSYYRDLARILALAAEADAARGHAAVLDSVQGNGWSAEILVTPSLHQDETLHRLLGTPVVIEVDVDTGIKTVTESGCSISEVLRLFPVYATRLRFGNGTPEFVETSATLNATWSHSLVRAIALNRVPRKLSLPATKVAPSPFALIAYSGDAETLKYTSPRGRWFVETKMPLEYLQLRCRYAYALDEWERKIEHLASRQFTPRAVRKE